MNNHSKVKFWLLSGTSLLIAACGLWLTAGKGMNIGGVISAPLSILLIIFAQDFEKNRRIVNIIEAPVLVMSLTSAVIVLLRYTFM